MLNNKLANAYTDIFYPNHQDYYAQKPNKVSQQKRRRYARQQQKRVK